MLLKEILQSLAILMQCAELFEAFELSDFEESMHWLMSQTYQDDILEAAQELHYAWKQ